MERDSLLNFQKSCEGLPTQLEEVKNRIECLEEACEKLRSSIRSIKDQIREMKHVKLAKIRDYNASFEHTKKTLEAYSAGFNFGLKRVNIQYPTIPVKSITMSLSSVEIKSRSQMGSSAPPDPFGQVASSSSSKEKGRKK